VSSDASVAGVVLTVLALGLYRVLRVRPAPPPPVVSAPPPPPPFTRVVQVVVAPPAPPVAKPPPVVAKPAPSPRPAVRFYGPQENLVVAGRSLAGPLAYVSPDGVRADASTIDTSLRVGIAAGAEPLPYWPTYAGASPAQRAVLLDWHVAGRADPDIPIGYVFLHFYGLERRALVDRADADAIAAELLRLVAIYGGNRSFRSYATALLAFMSLPAIPTMSEELAYARFGQITSTQLIAMSGLLAWCHVHGRPLPKPTAMQLASTAEGAKRGVVVSRARAEFDDLFAIRYRERFGDGLRVVAAKRDVAISYHAGSPSLLSAARQLTASIPSVLGRPAQFKPLVDLWNECVADLKKLGTARRTGGDAPLTADAWLALPAELRTEYDHPAQAAWDAAIAKAPRMGAFRIVTAGELATLAGQTVERRVTGVRMRRAVETAALLGYAVEPDARIAPRMMPPRTELAIWKSDTTATPDAHVWRSIHTMLSLTLAVALADGEVSDEEAQTVHTLIASLYPLDDALRSRVAALRMLLTRTPTAVTGIARKLAASRRPDELEKIGRLLVAIAAVDRVITDGELRELRALYKALGVAATALDAAIAASGARLEADGLVEATPQPALNRAAIDAILAETREVADILSNVLDDEDDDVEPASGPVAAPPPVTGDWPSLDPRYGTVLRELLGRPTWTRDEIRALAGRSNLMPGAILETLNAWSEEHYGDFVIDDAGDWTIHAALLERTPA
jgi:uncharacterized tellurite resistance protein B-like protein